MKSNQRNLRVCYFGTYRATYNRNQLMIEGLRQNGVDVVECHVTLWRGIEDRVQATSGGWMRPAFWGRVLSAYARLLWQFAQIGDFDILIVGYPGQFDVYLARLLSWLRRKPLAWDILMSIYLVALERGLDQRSRFTVNMLRLIERGALHLPDLLIHDTTQYAAWHEQTHGIPARRFRLVPIGADNRIFRPIKATEAGDSKFIVTYHGSFIPNHGTKHIIEAARLLRENSHISFELIGQGPDLPLAHQLAEQYQLTNVTFTEWVEKAALPQHLGRAEVCLGAFSQTSQSLMTVHNKIYEGLAMGKAVITGASPAIEAILRHGEEIYLCGREDGAALAQAIQTLYEDENLRQRIARQGYQRFCQEFDISHLGQTYRQHLEELLSGREKR